MKGVINNVYKKIGLTEPLDFSKFKIYNNSPIVDIMPIHDLRI